MVVIYVERLTLEWLRGFVLPLFHAKPDSRVRIFFFDHDDNVLIRARELTKAYSVSFEEVEFECVDVVDKEGISIRLKVVYQELAFFTALIRRDIPVLAQEELRLATYLEKTPIALEELHTGAKYLYIRQVITLINVLRWHADKIDLPQDKLELHLFQRPFFGQLGEYARSRKVVLCSMGEYRFHGGPWQKAVNVFSKLNGKIVWALIRHFFSKILGKSNYRIEDRSGAQAKLLVESRLQLNSNLIKFASDLFFLDKEGIRGKDILMMFNGSFNPVDKQKLKTMRQYGIQAVALTPQSSLVPRSEVPVFSSHRINSQVDHRWNVSGIPKDFSQLIAAYFRSRDYWEEFFTQNNVRLWTSFYKNEPEHVAMADALTKVGGISTMYQRSYESNPCPVLAIGSDIIFSFSKAEYEIEKFNGSDFRYHIAVGYLGDYRFQHLKAGAQQLRARLNQAGAKHIVAFFDENTIKDGRWCLSHRFAQDNYAFLLDKILEDPTLGLFIKPKVPKTLRKRLGAIVKTLEAAEKTGRCYVFEEGEIQSPFPPAMASLASDIAIQEMLCSGSAGLESALAGTRTILMDFEGWPRSPLYRLGPQVVFRDWENAWQACLEYLKKPSSRPRLGDWSAMIDELDGFHDGLAAHRMSCYLKDLLDGLRLKEVPSAVMERAAENYAHRWGKDKVQRGINT